MGCDIHAVWQAKVDGLWVDIESTYEENRHYRLFALLGGIRNGDAVNPIAERRGCPDDFSIVDDYHGETWLGDHSHSWASAEEMLAARPVTEAGLDYFFDEVRRLHDLHGDVRIVFGFDS